MITNFLSSEGGLKSGGTISGDVTIAGDLTVQGNGAGNYDEIIEGNLVLSAGSRLGVGTGDATPSALLHVFRNSADSSLLIECTHASSSAYIDLRSAADRDSNLMFREGSTLKASIFNDASADSLVLTDGANSNTVFIKSDSVGIGTDSPYSPLHVKSSAEGSIGGLEATDGTFIPQVVIEGSGTTAAKMSPTLALFNSSTGADGDTIGSIMFMGGDSDTQPPTTPANASVYAGMYAKITDETNSSNDGELHFLATKGNDNTNVAMSIVGSNVGIGGVPAFPLHVIGATSTNGGSRRNVVIMDSTSAAQGTGGGISLGGYYDGTSSLVYDFATIQGIKETSGQGNYASALTFATRANGGSTQEQMRIDSSGNVGIGTDSPDAGPKLHIHKASAGSIASHSSAVLTLEDDGTNILQFLSPSDQQAQVRFGDTSDDGVGIISYNHDGDTMSFAAGGPTRMKLDSNSRISLSNNGGTETTVFGYQALNAGIGGSDVRYSVAVGHRALMSEDSTDACTAIGYNALSTQNQTGVTANTGVGYQASMNNETGTNNTSLGYRALKGSDNHSNNTAVGSNALLSVTTGSNNVAIGYNSLDAGTDAHDNTAIGFASLGSAVSVGYAVAIGNQAINNGNVTADADGAIGIGYKALYSLTSGAGNTAVGYQSQRDFVEGYYNTSLGYSALGGLHDTTADASIENVAVGYNALAGDWVTATSSRNVAVGAYSSDAALNGVNGNVAVGYATLGANITGDNNVVIGDYALDAGTESSNVIAIGANACGGAIEDAADGTIAIGRDALLTLTTGAGNVAIGYTALDACTTGGSNIAIGDTALTAIVTGGANVAIGRNAGQALGAAENGNILIGMAAGQSLDEGTNGTIDSNIAIGKDSFLGGNLNTGATAIVGNIAIGTDALNSTGTNAQTGTIAIGHDSLTDLTSGAKNTAIGYQSAGNLTTGGETVIIGYQAGASSTIGNKNVLLGVYAGNTIVEDSNNTAVGYSALLNANGGGSDGSATDTNNTAIGYNSADVITTGTNNTCLGANTDPSANSASNQTVIGASATGQADNSVVLGNADVTDVYMAQDKGATVHADYVISQGNQNHVANTMSSPYYRFDGTDDQIDIADNAALDLSDEISIECLFKTEAIDTYQELVNKADAAQAYTTPYRLNITNGGLLHGVISNGSSSNTSVTSSQLTAGQWYHGVFTVDGSNLKLYLNGTLVDTESQTITPETQNGILTIGRWGDSGAEYYPFLGEMQKVRIYNKALTATEVKEMYSGASVPFKYKSANQTDMVTNGGFADGSNWTISGGWDINTTTAGKARFLKDGSGIDYIEQNVGLVKGKMYRITFTISDATNAQLAIYNNDTSSYGSIKNSSPSFANFTNTANGTYVVDFLATASGKLVIAGHQNSGSAWDIDDISLIPIGAVAEYDGSGIASDKWFDKSGNDLHGTVSGASVENAPSNDDGLVYEEGTWTAVYDTKADDLSNFSMYSSTGFYKRIGNMVTVSATMSTTGAGSISSSSNNDIVIEGLPYTCNSTQRNVSAIVAGRFQNAPDRALVASGTTEIELRRDFETTLKVGDFTASASNNQNVLEFIITYFI